MRWEEAILSKDLPTALLNHAEYEPIVPPSAASTENEADDNKKAEQEMPSPVDPNFNPYDSSILIGVTAVVKNGPHKGLTGKITEIQERGVGTYYEVDFTTPFVPTCTNEVLFQYSYSF